MESYDKNVNQDQKMKQISNFFLKSWIKWRRMMWEVFLVVTHI